MIGRIVVAISARGIVPLALLCAAAHAQTYEQGLASWYGAPFHSQPGANGQTYDQEQLTAAHRTLPFGTTVRIRRVDTGASVVVRINDRGPFIESRIIDLSNAAARKLDMLESGVVQVVLEILHAAAPAAAQSRFGVQAGTFRVLANAERVRSLMERLYGEARILASGPANQLWCVLVGAASAQADAESLAALVRKSGSGFQSAFVVRFPLSDLPVTD